MQKCKIRPTSFFGKKKNVRPVGNSSLRPLQSTLRYVHRLTFVRAARVVVTGSSTGRRVVRRSSVQGDPGVGLLLSVEAGGRAVGGEAFLRRRRLVGPVVVRRRRRRRHLLRTGNRRNQFRKRNNNKNINNINDI